MTEPESTPLSTTDVYGQLLVKPLFPMGRGSDMAVQATPTLVFEERPCYRLQLAPGDPALRLTGADGVDWERAVYLTLDAFYDADHNGSLLLHFHAHGEEEPRFRVRFGLFPRLWTRVTLPLEVLDGQSIYLKRTPGRLKGVCQGHRLNRDEISHVTLSFDETGDEQVVYLNHLALLADEPEYLLPGEALVDALGQWKAKEWPGKTPGEAALRERVQAGHAVAEAASFPSNWSRFGGTREVTFEATGFFHVEQREGRWWLADPEGCAFWSAGLDCVRPGEAAAIVPGTRPLFQELPPKEGRFAAAWQRSARDGIEFFDFHIANLIRAFGDDWRSRWRGMTAGRLRQWRFNTVANWSDEELARKASFPYVTQLPRFPTTATRLFRDFPDVYSAEYEESARQCAAALESYRDDPHLIGYFMVNEPHWAFGEFNLASEMLEQNPGTATRAALAEWLRDKYGNDASAWSAAWGHPFGGFDDVTHGVFHRIEDASTNAKADLWEFSKAMVRRCITIASAAAREADPNHLNLGVRYAWVSSELCYEGGGSFDVFSINNYSMEPPLESIARIAERTGRPTIIGEYHFGAIDRGLPSSGLRRVSSQGQRGIAYRRYIEQCAANPNTLGAHYFILNDQALLGRFDGENYQIGLVDCCHTPYEEFVDGIRTSHERLYEVRLGRTQPFAQQAEELPRLF